MASSLALKAHNEGRITGGVFLLKGDPVAGQWRWVPIRNVAARGGAYSPDPVVLRGVQEACEREGYILAAIFHNEWSKVTSRVGASRRWESFTPLELHWLPPLGRSRGAVVRGRKTSAARMRRETRELWRVQL